MYQAFLDDHACTWAYTHTPPQTSTANLGCFTLHLMLDFIIAQPLLLSSSILTDPHCGSGSSPVKSCRQRGLRSIGNYILARSLRYDFSRCFTYRDYKTNKQTFSSKPWERIGSKSALNECHYLVCVPDTIYGLFQVLLQ